MDERTWVEVHAYCGDCSRRIKERFDCKIVDLKTIKKLVGLYHEPGNMACSQCSNKQ